MGLNLGYDADKLSHEIYRWLRIFPQPDLTFLLDLDENIAFSRKNDVSSIEYLKERRGLYLDLASRFGFTILDGNKPTAELCDKVNSIVKII